jgi:hypothetical protein
MEPGRMLIRARCEKDIKNLYERYRKVCPSMIKPTSDDRRDYRFRLSPMFLIILARQMPILTPPATPSDLRQSRRRFLQRLAANRYIEFMNRFAIVPDERLRYSRGHTGLMEHRRRCPA